MSSLLDAVIWFVVLPLRLLDDWQMREERRIERKNGAASCRR